MILEQEQVDLLCLLVETARSIPREKREKFHLIEASGETFLKHWALPNWNPDCYRGDIEILDSNGLLNLTVNQSGSYLFDLRPEAFAYYEKIKNSQESAPLAVQETIREYLFDSQFERKYPAAVDRWSNAERKLWSADSHKELTTIGLLCREALQEFIDAMVQSRTLPGVDPDKSHTVARLRSLMNRPSAKSGNALFAFLEALLAYSGCLDDLVQRQVHGGTRERLPLEWEDARRVVFQTAVVMYEIHRAFEYVDRVGTA